MNIEESKMAALWSCLVDQVADRTADLVVERLGSGRAGEEEVGDETLNVAEAAAFLKLGMSTVYKLASSGRLASTKPCGRLLFRRVDLVAFLEAHRRGDEVVGSLAKAARKGE